MGRTSDAHLTQNDIDWLLASPVSAGLIPSSPPEDPEPVQKHLNACAQCRQRLERHESFMRRLRALEESSERVKTTQLDCHRRRYRMGCWRTRLNAATAVRLCEKPLKIWPANCSRKSNACSQQFRARNRTAANGWPPS